MKLECLVNQEENRVPHPHDSANNSVDTESLLLSEG
ncbi:hypothetical protein SLEP1_g53388 [Rubroshorea leprosula]|uniref:Uncharacterized protein n=1 Tax=Rubroshorea leprosula TaxID=152421 RepID=A0AAV5MCT3_9ROSI|nr:hypothetical protein SLEP1_g53388 [Rubroshorea leprosula]